MLVLVETLAFLVALLSLAATIIALVWAWPVMKHGSAYMHPINPGCPLALGWMAVATRNLAAFLIAPETAHAFEPILSLAWFAVGAALFAFTRPNRAQLAVALLRAAHVIARWHSKA